MPFSDPSAGISLGYVNSYENTFTCKFKRSNFNTKKIANYFEMTDETRTQFIAAYGNIDSTFKKILILKKNILN